MSDTLATPAPSSTAPGTEAHTDAPGTVLWYTRCPVPSPLGIAARLGWLETEFQPLGLQVKSIIDSPVKAIRESHFSHHLAWSFRQGGNIPPLWARAQGAATRLVALTWTDEFQAVIARRDSPLRSAADLAGRRLGVPLRVGEQIDFHRATALKGLHSALGTAGLGWADIVPVDLTITEPVLLGPGHASLHGLRRRHPYLAEISALERGEVDAVFVKGAEGIVVANLIGAQTVVETGHHPDPRVRINNGTPRLLTVDEALARDRPDLVQRLLALVRRGGEWAEAHPDETLRFVAREIGSTEEAVLASNGPEVHRHLGLSLAPELLDAVDHFKGFLLQQGFLSADFSVADWVDAAPLESLGALALEAA